MRQRAKIFEPVLAKKEYQKMKFYQKNQSKHAHFSFERNIKPSKISFKRNAYEIDKV